jgi:hypothetical protein
LKREILSKKIDEEPPRFETINQLNNKKVKPPRPPQPPSVSPSSLLAISPSLLSSSYGHYSHDYSSLRSQSVRLSIISNEDKLDRILGYFLNDTCSQGPTWKICTNQPECCPTRIFYELSIKYILFLKSTIFSLFKKWVRPSLKIISRAKPEMIREVSPLIWEESMKFFRTCKHARRRIRQHSLF